MKDFTSLVDLAAERLGGRVLVANDEFFAPKENLLKESKPVFIEGKYTTRGKWMDGWETRRRRTPGYDWCVIRLGTPGVLRGVVVDTSFFTGNFPPRCSLEACCLTHLESLAAEKKALLSSGTPWVEVLPECAVAGDSRNLLVIENPGVFSHLRLRIFPDGGVARLRVHGEVVPNQSALAGKKADLCFVKNGGSIIGSSDQFYGNPLNMLMPGASRNMGDGWETRRRRGPGYDWAIVKLGVPGRIEEIEVDTSHFKGNFPESCSLEACYFDPQEHEAPSETASAWKPLLPRRKLEAHHRHSFRGEVQEAGVATHVRLNIYPDGGIARLRLYGRSEASAKEISGIARFNELKTSEARKVLLDCCGSRRWVSRMLEQKPYASVDRLLDLAAVIWNGLEPTDWLEAFLHHPAIGEKKAEAAQSENAKQWSAGEQSVSQMAAPETLARLAEANREYREKFGFVFLICATGKAADEILDGLERRLPNDRQTELQVAAEEQLKITQIRLKKFLGS